MTDLPAYLKGDGFPWELGPGITALFVLYTGADDPVDRPPNGPAGIILTHPRA